MNINKSPIFNWLLCIRFVLVVGILLAIYQFAMNRSLWLDEGYLSLNLLNKDFSELLQPLDHKQVAPIIFLFIEKFFLQLVPGLPDYALRILPLVCFIASAVLFYKVVMELFTNRFSSLVALSIFIFNPFLFYYASEIKQYSSDVLLSVIFLYIIVFVKWDNPLVYIKLTLFGIFSIFFSSITPILLFTLLVYLLLTEYKVLLKYRVHVLTMLSLWSVFFIMYYLRFVYKHPHKAGMIEEWSLNEGFMPRNIFDSSFYMFLIKKYEMIGSIFFGPNVYSLVILGCLIFWGIWRLIQHRKFPFLLVCTGAIVVHFVLSSFKMYPIGQRLVLYTLPGFIIVITFGIDFIFSKLITQLNASYYLLFLTPLIMLFYLCKDGIPLVNYNFKEALTIIKKKGKETDKVYVNYFSRFPVEYYYQTNNLFLNPQNVVLGLYSDKKINETWTVDTLMYDKELSQFKGRTWMVFTFLGDEYFKIDYLNRYRMKHHVNVLSVIPFKGGELHLYDFSKFKLDN